MLTNRGADTRAYALFLVSYLPQSMHAAVIHALVWCAAYAYHGKAMQILQMMSSSSLYKHQLAEEIQRFPHGNYVDRLHIDVLWLMVPYLYRCRANTSLMRLYECNSRAAVKAGVLTALVASNVGVTPPVDCIPTECPASVHEAVHYMLVRRTIPPNRFLVDAALGHTISTLALHVLSSSTAGLNQQIRYAHNWKRRQLSLWALKHAHLRIFVRLRDTEFAWRIVFSFL